MPHGGKTIKILLMDDDGDVRLLAQRMARRLGVELEDVADGDAAVAAFERAMVERASFDAVVLDVTIPGKRGAVEVLKGLREIDPGIAAVVTSGYTEGGIVAHYEAFGFGAFLAKPFDEGSLSAAVEQARRAAVSTGNGGGVSGRQDGRHGER